jgi:hypothetical protein
MGRSFATLGKIALGLHVYQVSGSRQEVWRGETRKYGDPAGRIETPAIAVAEIEKRLKSIQVLSRNPLCVENPMNRMMLRTFAGLLAAAGLAVNAPAADSDGYVALFNGKDMTGWKIHPETNKKAFPKIEEKKDGDKVVGLIGINGDTKTTMWEVKDGLLIGGGAMSHIFTEKGDYSNFKFRVEMKINNKGNSGMFFRAGFRAGVPKGYEAQLNATHTDRVKTGSIYPNGEFGLDKFKPKTCVMDKAAHQPDEFFIQEVVAEGAKLTTYVNGVKQIEWTDPDHRFKEGHFALQAHDPGSIMTFRKVEVKVIK